MTENSKQDDSGYWNKKSKGYVGDGGETVEGQ